MTRIELTGAFVRKHIKGQLVAINERAIICQNGIKCFFRLVRLTDNVEDAVVDEGRVFSCRDDLHPLASLTRTQIL